MTSAFNFVTVGLTTLTLVLVYALFKHFARPSPSLSKIPGPKSPSFFLGNLIELFQRPVGEADFHWQRLYGDVIRCKTVFGVDQLLIADPKALQWIFNTSSDLYPKQPHLLVITRMVLGNGVVSADGEDHKRQRKILLPGFGASEARAFLRVSQGFAESMCIKWTEIIENSDEQKAIINVPDWISRAALDAIGEAAFGVQFGTIHDHGHPMARDYTNIMSDVLGRPSAQQVFIRAAAKYVPIWILDWVSEHGLHPRLVRAREAKKIGTEVARNLVREKTEKLMEGKGCRDIFTLLVKANMDADAKNKVTEEEVMSQVRTVLLAGHETTATSLSWIFLEVARHPKVQSRLRAEIRQTEAVVHARGDTRFTTADFDAMAYTTAVIKEGLRYHCVVPHVQRIASRDNVLPLSLPIATETGEMINEVFIRKGTRVVASIAAYNRNTELWGEDAHEFNPDRWLENGSAGGKKPISIGIYSNQMTFISGSRGCLGWRFALAQIQAFLVEAIRKFELSMTDRAERVSRQQSGIMTPIVLGEFDRGPQVPLTVSFANNEHA